MIVVVVAVAVAVAETETETAILTACKKIVKGLFSLKCVIINWKEEFLLAVVSPRTVEIIRKAKRISRVKNFTKEVI